MYFMAAMAWAVRRSWRVTQGQTPPASDFILVWQPIAERVIAGAPLYSSGVADNKPPLFFAIDILTAMSGYHTVVFILLTGIVNGLIAVVLWRIGRQYDSEFAGVLAGVLYLACMPLFEGQYIQAGSYTVLFVLLAIQTDRALWSGVWIAISGLIYQYSVILVPVVFGYQYLRDSRAPVKRGGFYIAGGLFTVVVVFLGVALVYSPRSALLGLHWSFGLPTGVTSEPVKTWTTSPDTYASGLWILTNQAEWTNGIKHAGKLLIPLLIPAAFAIRSQLGQLTEDSLSTLALVFALVSCVPFFIRSYLDYMILSLPFFCLLASEGVQSVIRSR